MINYPKSPELLELPGMDFPQRNAEKITKCVNKYNIIYSANFSWFYFRKILKILWV